MRRSVRRCPVRLPVPGPLAQLVEQGTLNPKVVGSIPTRPIHSIVAGTADPVLLSADAHDVDLNVVVRLAAPQHLPGALTQPDTPAAGVTAPGALLRLRPAPGRFPVRAEHAA